MRESLFLILCLRIPTMLLGGHFVPPPLCASPLLFVQTTPGISACLENYGATAHTNTNAHIYTRDDNKTKSQITDRTNRTDYSRI